MRELAPFAFRIKIQFIEFLCENSQILSPPPHGGGLANLRLCEGGDKFWVLRRLVPSVPAKGPGTSAEGSQICDFMRKVGPGGRSHLRFAKVADLRALRHVAYMCTSCLYDRRCKTSPPLREAKGARSRIKIQYIEFLCDMRRRTQNMRVLA